MKDIERLKPLMLTFFVVITLYSIYSFIPYVMAQDTDLPDEDDDPSGPGCCGALFCFAFFAPLLLPFIFIFIGLVFTVGVVLLIVWAVKRGTNKGP